MLKGLKGETRPADVIDTAAEASKARGPYKARAVVISS